MKEKNKTESTNLFYNAEVKAYVQEFLSVGVPLTDNSFAERKRLQFETCIEHIEVLYDTRVQSSFISERYIMVAGRTRKLVPFWFLDETINPNHR